MACGRKNVHSTAGMCFPNYGNEKADSEAALLFCIFLAKAHGEEIFVTYGKLVNGQLVPAPNPLRLHNGEVYDPSGYLYAAVGYKLIVDTPVPEAVSKTSCFVSHWEEQEGQIIRVWTETDPPASSEPKLADCAGAAEDQGILRKRLLRRGGH